MIDQVITNNESRKREIYEYDVPESMKNNVVGKTIGLIRLRGDDELEATKNCGGESVRLGFELVKMSMREVDGRAIDRSECEEVTIWNGMDPKLRQLLLAAYADLHTPEDDETENFLKARRVKVG